MQRSICFCDKFHTKQIEFSFFVLLNQRQASCSRMVSLCIGYKKMVNIFYALFVLIWLLKDNGDAYPTNSATFLNNQTLSRASSSGGYNYESCNKDNMECRAPRTCVREDSLATCQDTNGCVCLDKSSVACEGSNDCLPGDRCVEFTEGNYCYSCDMVANGEVNGKAADRGYSCTWLASICIAVDALASLPHHSLVYKQHYRALVLCDPNNSCATPGHVVIYKNVAMMMSTYCTLRNDCKLKKSIVNSPKFKPSLRIESRTNDLVYTALSARYVSAFEEFLLSAIIRLGL